jgi:Protein of unknown function DUF2625
MNRIIFILIIGIFGLRSNAQNKMRTIDELINKSEPGWALVKQWIDAAKNRVEILPCDTARAKNALYQTQVTTRSPMGAIIYTSGGLLVDNGWIRILGSGSKKLDRSLPEWNKGKSFNEYGEKPSFLLVADDVVGGFFAVNGGALGTDPGKVYYLSPDNLKWEPMKLSYTDFLLFCFNSDLEAFYNGLRWNNWKDDIYKLDGNQVYNFFPMLWTKEGKDVNKDSKKPIPIDEQYRLNMDFLKQLQAK